MKKKVNVRLAVSGSRCFPTMNLLVLRVLGFSLFTTVSLNALSEDQDGTRNTTLESSSQRSTKASPLEDAKISALNFSQAVKLGMPLAVIIQPDTPSLFSVKDKPAKREERLIENNKR
ncbi:MAG: hypothetical protein WBA20_21465 [Ketobacter sp.]